MRFALSEELEVQRKAEREFAANENARDAGDWDAYHYFPHRDAPTINMVEGSANICKWIIAPDQLGYRKANR